MDAFANGSECLAASEQAFCDYYDRMLAGVRRAEVRALYDIAIRLYEHKATIEDVRGSLLRCGAHIKKDRTTLLRYAFVPQRIKPGEFEQVVALSDARGYPVTFWDLVEVAEFSREHRLQDLKRRLAARYPS